MFLEHLYEERLISQENRLIFRLYPGIYDNRSNRIDHFVGGSLICSCRGITPAEGLAPVKEIVPAEETAPEEE